MAAQPQILAGAAAALYKNTATYASPTWVDQGSIKDVRPKYGWSFAEGLSRVVPVKLFAKAMQEWAFEVTMRADPADAIYIAWIAAHFSRTAQFDVMVLNALIAVEGARGVRFPALISLQEEAQEIEGGIYSTFELRPTIDTAGNYPATAVVGAASAVTYTPVVF